MKQFLHVSEDAAQNLPISIASMKVGANWADTVASSNASWKFPNKTISYKYRRANSQLLEPESTLNVVANNVFLVLGCWSRQISEKVLWEHLTFGRSVLDLFYIYLIG